MEAFWSYPNSCERSGSQQYRTILFYHNDEQKKLALASRERIAKKLGHAVETPILPAGEFTLAEDYHQKFHLRQNPDLAKELTKIYPDLNDFTNSTAAMKLNAYLAGHGSRKTLDKEIDSFGLSAEGTKKLREFVGNFSDTVGEGK